MRSSRYVQVYVWMLRSIRLFFRLRCLFVLHRVMDLQVQQLQQKKTSLDVVIG